MPLAVPCAGLLLVVLAMRVRLHSVRDQQWAHGVFSWGVAVIVFVLAFSFHFLQRRYVLVSNISQASLFSAAALMVGMAVFAHRLAIPIGPRLIIYFAGIAGRGFVTPATSVLGQPDEGLIVVAAFLLGELIGHTFEINWRWEHLEARRDAKEAERLEEQRRRHEEERARVLKMLFPQVTIIVTAIVTALATIFVRRSSSR